MRVLSVTCALEISRTFWCPCESPVFRHFIVVFASAANLCARDFNALRGELTQLNSPCNPSHARATQLSVVMKTMEMAGESDVELGLLLRGGVVMFGCLCEPVVCADEIRLRCDGLEVRMIIPDLLTCTSHNN